MQKKISSHESVPKNYIPQFNLGNPSITNTNNSVFKMDAPFLITLEYCSGIHSENDRICLAEISPEDSFYICSETNKLFNSSSFLHQHDFYEIMLVLDGNVLQIIEDKEYLYHTGSACLINRNIRHTEKIIGETQLLFIGMSVPFITSIIEICKTPLFREEDDFLTNKLWSFFLDDIKHTPQQKVYLDFFPSVTNHSVAKILRSHAEHLFQLCLFPENGTTANIIASICSLFRFFCDTAQYHLSFIQLNAKADYMLFCHISHAIEEKNGRISRQELQEIFHYTPDYLARIVKKYSGVNLFDYSMNFCLEKALQMIVQSDKPITAIAEELGFTNRYHFYKIFHEKYGMTPNEYRKSQKKNK